jgi:hypothetical protein
MPEPVSLGLIAAGYAALYGSARQNSGISREAGILQNAATAIVEYTERSYALFGRKDELLSRLNDLTREASIDDWDGEGGVAVPFCAAWNASNFIRALPDHLPFPDVAIDPDGAISLDWIENQNRVFSVSISGSARIAFAWVDGTDSGNGVARFDGVTLPPRILKEIGAFANTPDVALRAA